MPLECYVPKHFQFKTRALIRQANAIIAEYRADGFQLTLRQLYYQFVARDLIPNKQTEYKRLGDVLNDARLAGLVDWDAIIDRTRNLESLPFWSDPTDILSASANQYREPLWDSQPLYVEVWIEKDALIGVIETICRQLRVPFFACRGYTSQSEMWSAGKRFREKIDNGQEVLVLHLGDHDPSGQQMSVDNMKRLVMFAHDPFDADYPDEREDEHVYDRFDFQRIALNMDQIKQYSPPPNPAKETDSRIGWYKREFGTDSSWELDALDPRILRDLISREVTSVIDRERWDTAKRAEDKNRTMLRECHERWQDVVRFLSEREDEE